MSGDVGRLDEIKQLAAIRQIVEVAQMSTLVNVTSDTYVSHCSTLLRTVDRLLAENERLQAENERFRNEEALIEPDPVAFLAKTGNLPEDVCENCHRPGREHGGRLFSCPPHALAKARAERAGVSSEVDT